MSLMDHSKISKIGDKKGKHLIFTLNEEDYGIQLGEVKEVIGMQTNIRPIPHTPNYYIGLINLRGHIISVIDLRIKLNVFVKPYEEKKTAIIITEIQGINIGIIVDDVKQVNNFNSDSISPWKSDCSNIDKDFIKGVSKNSEDGGLTLLLNIEKCLNIDEIKKNHEESNELESPEKLKVDTEEEKIDKEEIKEEKVAEVDLEDDLKVA